MKTVQCSKCEETLISAKGKRCRDDTCDKVYCPSCADEQLTGVYCDDHKEDECCINGCDEKMDRNDSSVKHCSNPECTDHDDPYCNTHATRWLNAEGKCTTCSGERYLDCDGCNEEFTESRLTWCKEEDCEKTYCSDCQGDNLTDGWCSDHNTLKCSVDGCDEDIDRGKEKRCSNPKCDHKDWVACQTHASLFFNAKGECSDCSGEEEWECDDCGETFTQSCGAGCKETDCNMCYCFNCQERNLVNGWCDDHKEANCCAEGCSETITKDGSEVHCSNPNCDDAEAVYCSDHASRLLDIDGKCSECTGEEELMCDGCNEMFTSSKLTRCVGSCDRDYCAACEKDNLVDDKCEDCREAA